jgi:hypothetical protein
MRDKRRSNDLSQRSSIDVTRKFLFFIKFSFYLKEEDDILQQVVEHEYPTLYRQVHKAAQKTAR